MTPKEKAQEGKRLLKEAVYETIKEYGPIAKIEISRKLDIESADPSGNYRDWLCSTIRDFLLIEKKIKKEKVGSKAFHTICE